MTIEDMYKWDQALYTEQLVKASTLKEAFTSGQLNNGKSTGYGFGWDVRRYLGHDVVSHDGSWLGFRTNIVRIPSQYFTVGVLANLAQIDVSALTNQIIKIFIEDN